MTRQAVSSSSNSSNSEGKENVEEEKTALQKHVAFFDRNKDGVVYPWETYQGFRALGTGRIMSAINAVIINMGLSQKTRPGKIPSPLFPIEVKNIHLGIHGSDTDIYDKHGRFVESKFEKMFRKHSNTHTDALTGKEVKQILKSNREPFDIGGWFSAFIEWKTLRDLGEDGDGLLKKDTVRGVYDGSFFYRLEKQLKKQRRLR